MGKTRLEAFSDGVLAITITIMVLEMKVPHDPSPAALVKLMPVFLSYVLSFVYVGIYWNNHHHMLHTPTRVTGPILWANLHLLFWISLFPFATGWMGENHFAPLPSAIYGVVLLAAAIAYYILSRPSLPSRENAQCCGGRWVATGRARFSPLLYLVGIGLTFLGTGLAQAIYVLVALVWLVPDKRIERVAGHEA